MATYNGTIAVNNNTQYSDAIPVDAESLTLVVEVEDGAAVDVVLEAAVDPDKRWTETALEADGLDNLVGQLGPEGGDGSILAAFPYYRVKVTSAGANTVAWRLKELS